MGERLHRPVRPNWMILTGAVAALLLVYFAWNQTQSTVTLVFGGDIMLARDGKVTVPDASAFGDALAILRDANLALANLESPLSEVGAVTIGAGYNLCAPGKSASILRDAGFDVLAIANNHADDCSAAGAVETGKQLDAAGIAFAGDSQEPILVKVKGRRIALLAYEDVTQSIDLERIRIAITKARGEADLVVVSVHWGNEYQAGPDERQVGIAQALADAGVDVIWGHHPHVLQRMEWLHSTSGAHQTLVMYSLGNLVSDQNMTDDVRKTALVRLRVQRGKIAGVDVIPLIRKITGSQLELAAEKDRQSILDRLKQGGVFD